MADVVGKLKPVLFRLEVTNVLIIDDSFDLGFDDFVTTEMWTDFRSAIDQNADIREELAVLGVNTETKSLKTLATLVDNQELFKFSMNVSAQLVANYESRMQSLRRLERLLGECGVNVIARRPSEGVSDDDKFDIAFIDFFLDDEDHPKDNEEIDKAFLERVSVKRSRELAVDVFKKTNAFIVLMSSFLSVEQLEDTFQQSTNFLLKGFFKFTPKSELDEDATIAERLIRLPLDKQLRKTVSGFADTLEKRFAEVAAEACKVVRDLSIQDYAHLCNLVLRKESHPLGDYLIRMVASHLVANLAQGDLESRKAELDRIFVKQHFPLQESPTAALAKLYSSHICEQLPCDKNDGWTPHPMFATDGEIIPLANLPFLQFGDLLTRDADSSVFLVLNAGCDLMFGPERTSRQPEDSVILLPGALRKLHEPIDEIRTPSAFTWLFTIGDQLRRIEWDFRRFHSIEHKDVERKCRRQGYKRNYRLGGIDALALQQGLLNHVGRVATQTPPLITTWHTCSIYCKGEDGKPERLGDDSFHEMLVGIHRRSSPDYVADELTMPDNGRRQLSLLLKTWLEEQRGKLDEQRNQAQERVERLEENEEGGEQVETPGDRQKRLDRRENVLVKLNNIVDGWKLEFELDGAQPFPGGRSKGASKNSESLALRDIVVCKKIDTDAKWTHSQLVILTIDSI